ncbi:MAG: DUF2760 domain-containing protein [Planctomycetia bacterium]|jgi:hypothetical protein
MRLFLAFATFFKVLFRRDYADAVRAIGTEVSGRPAAPKSVESKPAAKPAPPKPAEPLRSEAITLLAALQREARFVDFIKEPLDAYSDAQVGAASRDVHRECGRVLDRMFGIESNSTFEEGTQMDVPEKADPGCVRVVGNVTEGNEVSGAVVHQGWKATRCEVPKWTGSKEAQLVIAPTEVEVK